MLLPSAARTPGLRAFLLPALAVAFLLVGAGSAWAAPRAASIIIDADTGEVLQASNADIRTYPASLTKMMTLYLVFDALDAGRLRLDQQLSVSSHASRQSPSKLALMPGQTIAVEDVILALVTKSANDAAVVAAEALGGSEDRFAQMMTSRARQLGMRQTTFH
ncbi:MAG: serine hydrolase, partial [Rhodospirillales bacterium]|nr:serine hydrolase [Rhodospirillales bacterium]